MLALMFISEPTFKHGVIFMAENSKIEWCDHTFNPWTGCQKVSPGCDHCYAEHMADHRFGWVEWGPHGQRKRTSDDNWRKPLRWAKDTNGHRPRVFCASLADRLDNQVPRQWLGVTCEDQLHYERRWAILSRARIRATVNFVSYEPALGPLTKLRLQWGER